MLDEDGVRAPLPAIKDRLYGAEYYVPGPRHALNVVTNSLPLYKAADVRCLPQHSQNSVPHDAF